RAGRCAPGVAWQLWSTEGMQWSRCSRYLAVAYNYSGGTATGPAPRERGLLVLWRVKDSKAEGHARFHAPISSVSVSPVDPHRCAVCCTDGNVWALTFQGGGRPRGR
ncbi:unnamed protein product, partial [Discosporangium mesarthrocarpum]